MVSPCRWVLGEDEACTEKVKLPSFPWAWTLESRYSRVYHWWRPSLNSE